MSGYSFVTTDINAINGSVAVWDGSTGVNLMILKGNKLSKNSMTVINDIVVGCVEGKSMFEIWKLNSEGKKKIIPLPSPARAIEYSSQFQMMACFLGNEIFMWQPESGSLIGILKNVHSSLGTSIIFMNIYKLVTVDESGLVALWDLGNCECVWKCRPFGITTVYACAIEYLKSIIVVSESGKIMALSVLDGSSMCDMIGIDLTVKCIVHKLNCIYLGCNKATLAILDLSDMIVIKKQLKNESENDHDITQIVATPDLTQLFVVVDGISGFIVNEFGIPRTTKIYTFGSPLSCLRVVNTCGDMFITNNADSGISIGRLQFSPGHNDTYVGRTIPKESKKSNEQLFANLDKNKLDLRSVIQSIKDEQRQKNLANHLFSILNK